MPLKPEHQAAIDEFVSKDHTGKPLDRKRLVGSNPVVARILMARVSDLSDDERATLKTVITPDTMPVLKKLFPEISALLKKDESNGG